MAGLGEVLDARNLQDGEDVDLNHCRNMHVLFVPFHATPLHLVARAPFDDTCRRRDRVADQSSRDCTLVLAEVFPSLRGVHKHLQVLGGAPFPLVLVAFPGNPWADYLVSGAVLVVVCRVPSRDRPSSKDVARDMLTVYHISVSRESRNELEERLLGRMVSDGRASGVFEREDNRRQQNAFAVKQRVSQAHSLVLSQGRQYVKDNAVADVILSKLAVGHRASTISTWSCYYCRFSQLSSRPEALYRSEKKSGDQLPRAVASAVVDRIPSSCATEAEVVALPVEEASWEAAWRDGDLDVEPEVTMRNYAFDRNSIPVGAEMSVRPRNEGSFRRVLVAERTRKRHTQGSGWD